MSIFKRFTRTVTAAGLICTAAAFWTGAAFAQLETDDPSLTPYQWNIGASNNPNGGVNAVTATLMGSILTIRGTGAMAYNRQWDTHRENISNVIVEDGVTNIPESMFYEHTAFRTISIPNSVTSIGRFAFSRSGLTALDIPASVTTIGDNAISFLRDLTYINVAANNTRFRSVDSVLFNAAMDTLILYPPSKADTIYTIPNTVTSIRAQAFQHNRNLKTVIIPESVTRFGEVSFARMLSLTHITLPNSITITGNAMFDSSAALSSVTLGNALTEINRGTFQRCHALETIVFSGTTPPQAAPASLGMSPFMYMGIDSAQALNIRLYAPLEAVEAYRAHDTWGQFHSVSPILNRTWQCGVNVSCVFTAGIFMVRGTGPMADYAPAAELTSCAANAYGDPSLIMNCPPRVLSRAAASIAPTPWESYKNYITSVIIEDGVTSVGNAAFEGSINLTSVKIGAGVTSIGASAFENTNIDTVHIFSAVPPAVQGDAFAGVDMSAAVLFVPQTSITAFENAAGWGEFQGIASHAPTSIHGNAAFNRNRANSLSPSVSVRGKTLNVRLPASHQSSSALQIRMIDMRGRTAANFNMSNGTDNSFQLTKVPAGRYIVEIKQAGKRMSSTPVMVR
ncbi:MAG: leucine-rich repeat domain-containing protein [Chitinispirillia bacterium]|nr:leucine-rich repeat domain-containing protein [Chitinispirillia bacterium]